MDHEPFALKPISKAGVAAALQKAERYRLLNDSSAAESICRDVLEVEPDNQQAIVMLLLSITDQIHELRSEGQQRAEDLLPYLTDEYKRAYYAGIIAERRAKAYLRRHSRGSGALAYESLREAMRWYEKAEALRPAGNDESILRWNTCVRILANHPELEPRDVGAYEPILED